MRIMVVDDQPIIRAGFVSVLSSVAGQDGIEEVASAPEALVRATMREPRVVVIGTNPAGMSGYEACRQFGRQHPRTGVVLVSPTATKAALQDALESGAMAFLTRGAGNHEIRTAVRRAAVGE